MNHWIKNRKIKIEHLKAWELFKNCKVDLLTFSPEKFIFTRIPGTTRDFDIKIDYSNINMSVFGYDLTLNGSLIQQTSFQEVKIGCNVDFVLNFDYVTINGFYMKDVFKTVQSSKALDLLRSELRSDSVA